MGKLVSIIMPVYNTDEPLFNKAVKSVLEQHYGSFELLVIDDGSDKKTHLLCDGFSQLDNRIRVFHVPNGGVSKARNFGLDRAEGEFITFIDSDDSISPLYLENLIKASEQECAPYIKGGAERVYSPQSVIEPSVISSSMKVFRKDAFDDICFLKRPYPGIEITAVWGNLYSRSIIGNTRFREDTAIGEDFIFNCEIISKLDEVVYLQSKDYGYYVNEKGAMSGGYSEKKIASVDGFRKFISEYGEDGEYADEIINRLVNITIVILMMIPEGNEYDKERNDVISFIKKYRSCILRSRKTRFKVRIALLISYLSFGLLRRLYLR